VQGSYRFALVWKDTFAAHITCTGANYHVHPCIKIIIMKNITIHHYNGVEIHEVKFCNNSYFYPNFDGNKEFTSLQAIKDWIDGDYRFVRDQCEYLGKQLGVSGQHVFNFMLNLSGFN
jgi:hypothetical protein